MSDLRGIRITAREWARWPIVLPAAGTHGTVRRDPAGALWEWAGKVQKVVVVPWRGRPLVEILAEDDPAPPGAGDLGGAS